MLELPGWTGGEHMSSSRNGMTTYATVEPDGKRGRGRVVPRGKVPEAVAGEDHLPEDSGMERTTSSCST
jgi:hypothetical protein